MPNYQHNSIVVFVKQPSEGISVPKSLNIPHSIQTLINTQADVLMRLSLEQHLTNDVVMTFGEIIKFFSEIQCCEISEHERFRRSLPINYKQS